MPGDSVSGMFLGKEARSARNQVFMEAQANYVAEELGKLKGSVVKIISVPLKVIPARTLVVWALTLLHRSSPMRSITKL